MMHHLASAQYWDWPASGDTGRLFLAFGGPVCADRISKCPLGLIAVLGWPQGIMANV